MDKQNVEVRGHLRKGFAVRPHSRRMLLGRKTRKKNYSAKVAPPTEEEIVAPRQISQHEYLSLAEEEYRKIGDLENRINRRYGTPAKMVWAVGAVSLVAIGAATSGLTGLVGVVGGVWVLLALTPLLSFRSLIDKLKKRASIKASHKIREKNERPSKGYLEKIYQELGAPEEEPWKNWTEERENESSSWWKKLIEKNKLPPNGLKIHEDGTATLTQWNQTRIPSDHNSEYPIAETIQLYPRVDLSNRTIETPFFHGWYTDLREANFSNTNFFSPTTFRSALLQKANFSNIDTSEIDFVNADLREANFQNAILGDSVFTNAQIDGANFQNAVIHNTKKSNIDLSDEQLMSLHPDSFKPASTRYKVTYDYISFEKAIEKLGLTEKQFEFLVTSGALPVRDNETQEIVTKNFDSKQNHITRWDLLRTKEVLKN